MMARKRGSAASAAGSSSQQPAVSENDEMVRREIDLRAYFRYCERGCAPGLELDDWLAAEREVLAEKRAKPSRTE
jgi:hypothetical protein